MRCKLRRHVPSILIGIANLHHFPAATISHWCSQRYRVASALRQTHSHRSQQNICNFARKTNHVPRTADDAKNMRQLFSCTFKNIHFHRWRSISRRGGALYLTIGRPTGHGCKVNVTVEGKSASKCHILNVLLYHACFPKIFTDTTVWTYWKLMNFDFIDLHWFETRESYKLIQMHLKWLQQPSVSIQSPDMELLHF